MLINSCDQTENSLAPCFVYILNKIINAPCGTLKLLLALGVAKYIKLYKINFVVQYATDYCPLEHDNYKTISAHLGSPISCYINNLHGAFIFLLSVESPVQVYLHTGNLTKMATLFGSLLVVKLARVNQSF